MISILYSIDSPFLAASGCIPRADWPVLHAYSCCYHVFSCIFYADCIIPNANSVKEIEKKETGERQMQMSTDPL